MSVERIGVSCDNCVSACCRLGTRIGLTIEERHFLERAGTTIIAEMLPEEIEPTLAHGKSTRAVLDQTDEEIQETTRFNLARRLKQSDPEGNYGLFTFKSDCGNLGVKEDGTTYCKIHSDPQRPEVCKEFKPGSLACRIMRQRAGLQQQ